MNKVASLACHSIEVVSSGVCNVTQTNA